VSRNLRNGNEEKGEISAMKPMRPDRDSRGYLRNMATGPSTHACMQCGAGVQTNGQQAVAPPPTVLSTMRHVTRPFTHPRLNPPPLPCPWVTHRQ
jgi:hypothetical protein